MLSNSTRSLSHFPGTIHTLSWGVLCFLSNVTRPNIPQTVNSLASFMRQPHAHFWIGAKQVRRYLLGTAEQSLTYGPATSDCSARMHFLGCSDSDHGGAIERGRRSTTDYVFLVNGTPVSWQSKLQQT
eukprot:253273-Chlamydomonas_euryale.AAC.1